MNKVLTLTTALCLVAGAAHAHEAPVTPAYSPSATNNVTSQSGALAGAAARSASTSSAVTGPSTSSAVTGPSSSGSRSTTGPSSATTGPVSVNNSGGNYSARGNTPDVVSGGVSGANPCGLGGGIGTSWTGFGGIFHWMWEGKGCERRMNANALASLGEHAAAREAMCYDDTVRRARYSTGRPCARDVNGWDPR